LYVLSSFEQESSDASFAAEQVATFHDALFEPNEKTVTLRIRTMTANDDAAAAEALLESIPVSLNYVCVHCCYVSAFLTDHRNLQSCGWKRLRTYLPILTLYCNNGDMSSALRMYRRMQETSEVIFEPDTYALLLGSLAENGYFRRNAEPIQGFLSGPELFDELAAEMADDILELNNASARVIYNGFARGFAASDEIGLEPISDDAELQVTNKLAKTGELVVSRVEICKETAICPRTGAKLRLFKLTESQRKQVHETLLAMAATQYDDFRDKLEARFGGKMEDLEGSDFAIRELSKFSAWLE
jgi:pentatricopeptide repeat protein